jgi:hypothetical protein
MLCAVTFAAQPPELVNFQGVLRHATGVPQNGTFDMVFRFFDADTGGNEILVDSHTGGDAVTVTNGLFSVELGGGTVTPGSGPGAVSSLAGVFRDFSAAYVAVTIDPSGLNETLDPRIRIVSTGYALNADHLDGNDATFFLDSSGSSQAKTGPLALTELHVSGVDNDGTVAPLKVTSAATNQNLLIGGNEIDAIDTDMYLNNNSSTGINLVAGGGNVAIGKWGATEKLDVEGNIHASGNLLVDGTLAGNGSGLTAVAADLLDGMDSSDFLDTSSTPQTKAGDLDLGGDLQVDGGTLTVDAAAHRVGIGTPAPTDHLLEVVDSTPGSDHSHVAKFASTSTNPGADVRLTFSLMSPPDGHPEPEERRGEIIAYKNAFVNDGVGYLIRTHDGTSPVDAMRIEEDGDIDMGGDLTVDSISTAADLTLGGDDILFGGGSQISTSSSAIQILAPGNSEYDDVVLRAGSANEDGRLAIFGNERMELRSGNGEFHFYNGPLNSQIARLDADGTFQIDGDLDVDGYYVSLQGGGYISSTLTQLQLTAGSMDTSDLWLYAGNSLDDGSIRILGDDKLEFFSGNGEFSFLDGRFGSEKANLNAQGDLQLDGRLIADGNSIFFGDGSWISSSGDLTFRSAGGPFDFWNASHVETARLDEVGNLQIDGQLDIDGNALFIGSGPQVWTGGPDIDIYSGSGGDMTIHAGTGRIWLWNEGPHDFMSPNGQFRFQQTGYAPAAQLYGNGDLEIGNDLTVGGDFIANGAKSFVQNHPYRDDLSVVYAALEGDEAGTYTRGTARLVNGVAYVPLGETFAWVTNPDIGLTAHVTPRGQWAALYVESITTSEMVVRSLDLETANAVFDYVVHGLRIGYEEYNVLRERLWESTVPTAESYERYYVQHPDLRPYTALGRFERMQEDTWEIESADMSASAALRQAIGEHDLDAAPPGMPLRRCEEAGTGGAAIGPETPLTAGGGRASTVPVASERQDGVGAVLTSLPVDSEGNVYARSFRSASPELAAHVPVSEQVELGDILVAERERPGLLRLGDTVANPAVAGIVAGQPGLLLGEAGKESGNLAYERDHQLEQGLEDEADDSWYQEDVQEESQQRSAPVAFSGIVLCKVDAGYGSIQIGDLLTTSPTPGHAMRADDPAPGTIVAKALESLDYGTGLIKVLVMLR